MRFNYRQAAINTISLIATLLAIQMTFFFLQQTQAEDAVKSVQTVLRQEISSSNLFLISRTLTDFQDSGLIRCVSLTENESKKTYLDLTYKGSCGHSAWLLNGASATHEIRSLNGEKWEIHFESVPGRFFDLSLWLSRIATACLVLFLLNVYFKKEKLRALAAQAAHDVNSPVFFIRTLINSGLIGPEVKEYLSQGIDRVNEIVGSLKKQSDSLENGFTVDVSNIVLNDVVTRIVEEKRSSYPNISFKDEVHEISGFAEADILKRVLSNLINNAIEASTNNQPIEIHLKVINGKPTIIIRDNGNGISSEKLKQIGKRGVTFDKPKGSGLGLYHAISSLENWGGNLHIFSEEGTGTTVHLSFQTSSI